MTAPPVTRAARRGPQAPAAGRSPKPWPGPARIVEALRDHEMPDDEIRAVVGTDDPMVVHRYFELHRERLEERLAQRTVVLVDLERKLADACRIDREGG